MKEVLKLSHEDARAFYLQAECYFNNSLPIYIDFSKVLNRVDNILGGKPFNIGRRRSGGQIIPNDLNDVNYGILTNKGSRLDWRPLDLMHPVLYVSLVNEICEEQNWATLTQRFAEFQTACVQCCSLPVVSDDEQSNVATQIQHWWTSTEQRSITLSFRFSHLLCADVANCYRSLYTHSIEWALHGLEASKPGTNAVGNKLGSRIDRIIRASRYGQSNGICQGSALMDLVAEAVLGYVDLRITEQVDKEHIDQNTFAILRYRDDYRIFANGTKTSEDLMRIISTQLGEVGMSLNSAKTVAYNSVVVGSIKHDKLAGIKLQGLDMRNARTLQKQLLRLHSFGKEFPNSGALRRLLTEFYLRLVPPMQRKGEAWRHLRRHVLDAHAAKSFGEREMEEIERHSWQLAAIAIDIATDSPNAFPIIMAILSQILDKIPPDRSSTLWEHICDKVKTLPNNGLLEIWMQRAIINTNYGGEFESDENICKVVSGHKRVQLWNNAWIPETGQGPRLKRALQVDNIVDLDVMQNISTAIGPDEVVLFHDPDSDP